MVGLSDPLVGHVNQLTQQLLSPTAGAAARPALMRMDAWRDGDRFVAEFDLPGITPDSLDVSVERDVVTVRAERAYPASQDRSWLVAERPHGVFTRHLWLTDRPDPDKISADYTNGVLRLSIPVNTGKARKIAVATGAPRKRRHHLAAAWKRRWLPHAGARRGAAHRRARPSALFASTLVRKS
ncbi:Hsp20/alpha crystallin family protein [Mycobacterium botniense]|uniref:SHSP domain-containing protein n=1 Tax=Mycobacterium botniense TaxID=84962 RepID=A0A7I9XVY6_9MYCO|nr:Hsp20/alpha crystallin family protein [Mycobacterium botniense]GFG73945.1 hypothetical protein MBOT_13100 [Mycobacterium botniense]